ncbi:MAG: hypothetical protein ACUVWJ_01345 [Spirochaetota bacterium]
MEKKTAGIILIYSAAVLIMLSILFLFRLIRVPFAYSTAAFGFLLYVVGMFLSREGKLSPYRIGMIIISLLLIFLAITREIIKI